MKKLILVLSVVAMAAFLLVGCLPKTNTAPVITYSASQTATVGTEFISTVTATDAENDTLIFSVSDGPTGMVIDSATGVISGWTPAAVGTETVLVTVTDGKDPSTLTVTITVVIPVAGDITIAVATEWENTATGKTYLKGGSREITVTFPAAVDDPVVKVGKAVVPVFTVDNKVYKGTHKFVGDDAVLIEVGGVCDEDLCAAKSVVVDSLGPVVELEAKAAECECEDSYKLTITSEQKACIGCVVDPGCCADKGSGLKSWNVQIFDADPWKVPTVDPCDPPDCEPCCADDPCIDPIAELDGTACPIIITTECISKVWAEVDGVNKWVTYFDKFYWVIATLIDNVGNKITYNGIVRPYDDKTVNYVWDFTEIYHGTDEIVCWCPAESWDGADSVIGDCDGIPATECWEEPLNDCPKVTVVPAKPIEGQLATVTIDYTKAKKPVGTVHAYVGPAFKGLPDGVPEGSSELSLEEVADDVYVAEQVFSEAGDRIIYLMDASGGYETCQHHFTVLEADVCPVVEFLDYTWWEEVDGKDFGEYDIPGYGLTNVNFTVTFANRVEKELVKVYVGIPGLGPIFMPIPMPPTALQVAMTTTDEVTYNGTIPIGDIKEVVVGVINHYLEDQGVPPSQWVDPDQPFQSLPSNIQYLIHVLGCIPLRIYVLAGDPCCIEVCEYPFIVDPIGPFAKLEVTIEPCTLLACVEFEGCDPTEHPGHEIFISTAEPDPLCIDEDCCGDTCCGVEYWEAWICPCYPLDEIGNLLGGLPEGPFDECCDFTGCEEEICAWWWWNDGDDCPVNVGTHCLFDEADPFGIFEDITPGTLAEIWGTAWYLYVEMFDCAGNITKYKASMIINTSVTPDLWTVDVIPLCDDDVPGENPPVFGADYCVGEHF